MELIYKSFLPLIWYANWLLPSGRQLGAVQLLKAMLSFQGISFEVYSPRVNQLSDSQVL